MEHQTTSDSELVKMMSLVMGAIAILFFALVFVANIIVEPANTSPNNAKVAAMLERITPVGSVRTSADDAAGGDAVAEVSAEPKTGKQLAEGACLACHGAAVAAALNAPALGDSAAWGDRLSAGIDALVNNAINGKGAMPPRGGSSLSDDEIRLAVEYLAGQ